MTFEELYRTMLKQAVERGSVQADDLEASAGHLDCLLHPQDHPLVWPLNPCTCPKEETHCAAACLFDAIVRRDERYACRGPGPLLRMRRLYPGLPVWKPDCQPGRAALPWTQSSMPKGPSTP